MTSRFKKGAIEISVIVASSTLGIYGAAIGWTTLKTVATGEVVAALVEQNENIIESNKQIASALEAYRSQTDASITELKITTGTSNELLKLMSPRFLIEPEAVEKRVIQDTVAN